MSQPIELEKLTESLEKYIGSSFKLAKMEASAQYASIGAALISSLIIGFACILFILFISIGVSYYICDCIGNSYVGFIIVGGFYLLAGLILFRYRVRFVENRLRDVIVRKMYRID